MLERVLIPDNVLDRLARLEERLADLEAGAATVQVVETPSGASNMLNGWLATGSAFQDLLGRIVLDASLPGIRLDSGGIIYSADYQAGVSGFRIDGGTAEFNDVVVRGTVYASSGQIGGWSIGASALTGGNATLHSSGYLLLGTGNDVARLDASDAIYRLWIGNTTASNAPFRVTKSGALTATNASITGTIDANAGYLGTLTVDGVLTVGTSTPAIQIDGPNKRIRTSTYSAGLQGFNLDGVTGDAEFNNVSIRGTLRASTFTYGQVLATGGTLVIAKATGKLYANCTTGSTFNVDVADPDGMSHASAGALWATNDIIRLKDPLVGDTWAKITGKMDMTSYWRLAVSLQSGSSGVTFRAGTAVVNYGQNGQGLLWLTADDADAPFYSVRTHAGSPWSATTELARLGNLNGNWGYSSVTYGIALGEYASGKANLTWDSTNGLRLRSYTTTVLQLDNAGGASITGVLNIGTSGGIYQGTGTFGSPTTGLKIWNDSGVGRLATYNSGTLQVYFNTDGKLYAGGGNVALNSDGMRLNAVTGKYSSAAIEWTHSGTRYLSIGTETDLGAVTASYIESKKILSLETTDSGSGIYLITPNDGMVWVYYELRIQSGDLLLVNGDLQIQNGEIFTSGDVRVGGGIAVGSTTADPPAGSIIGSVALGCRVIRTTAQSIPNNSTVALSFDTEIHDTDNCWSSAEPTRLYAQHSGYYFAGGGWGRLAAQNPNASRHWIGIRLNGSTTLASNEVHTIANRDVIVSVSTGMFWMNAGDYIEVMVYQDSGAARDLLAASATTHNRAYGFLVRAA